jgi:hypothetical protein
MDRTDAIVWIVVAGLALLVLYEADSLMHWDAGAVATLIAGGAAVSGAVWIGLKQAQIMSKQADIYQKQTEIQDLMLRATLFERREDVLLAVHEFIEHGGGSNRWEKFKEAKRKARFVFGPRVMDFLNEVERISYVLSNANAGLSSAEMMGQPTADLRHERDEYKSQMDRKRSELEVVFADMRLDPKDASAWSDSLAH